MKRVILSYLPAGANGIENSGAFTDNPDESSNSKFSKMLLLSPNVVKLESEVVRSSRMFVSNVMTGISAVEKVICSCSSEDEHRLVALELSFSS